MTPTSIMSIPIQIIIFIFSLSLYVALVSKILPLLLLKAQYQVKDMGDRGLKKYTFEGGRAITFKPFGEVGKYIKQYILSENDGDKYIKCRFDERILSIKYDVVALDSCDREISTIQVSVPKVSSGEAAAVILPENTSYVCLVVKEVNRFVVPDGPKMRYPLWRVITFASVTAVLTVIEYLTIRSSVFSVMETVLPFLKSAPTGLPLVQILLSAVLGVALAGIILFLRREKDVKIFDFNKTTTRKS